MEQPSSTRRRFLTAGVGVALGSVALAGCTGDAAPTNENADGSDPYEVSMAPAGTVEFESVPETWSTYFPGYAEMGIALGQADGLTAIGNSARFHTDQFDELDGVSVEKDDLTTLIGKSGIDRELYFELDNDVHLTDPRWLTKNDFFGLESADLEQITSQVGPFFGNAIFRRTDGWHDYRYYTMYEAFETVAAVFQQSERYEAFASFHDEFIADVQADLPPASERPAALLVFAGSNQPEEFSPYRITDKGTNKKHLRDLGVEDALAGSGIEGLSESNRAKVDYETLLEVDPEYLLLRGHEDKSAAEFESTVGAFMADHSVASQLTAVQNGNVYRGGPIYQGPISNLFLTERVATSVYPDQFSGALFDREELAAIITGEE
jgi:iron complex transport system substrate-binding protein